MLKEKNSLKKQGKILICISIRLYKLKLLQIEVLLAFLFTEDLNSVKIHFKFF